MLKRVRVLCVCAVAGFAALSSGRAAVAAPIILDDFETGEGHFASVPTFSGSNRNVSAGTADPTTTRAQAGSSSELINFTAAVPPSTPTFAGTMLRFLSGGGTVANNVNIGPDGYVGYFLATTTPGLTTGIGLDDGAQLERGVLQPVIADGQFHLYQFNLDDPAGYTRFAGTGETPGIDGPGVSIDSIFILGPDGVSPTVYLDTVAYNPTGDLSSLVPEPSALALAGIGALGMLARRRRV
jgi:hypothetical protein